MNDEALESNYLAAVVAAAAVARDYLQWCEATIEQLAPQRFAEQAIAAATLFAQPFEQAAQRLVANPPPRALAVFGERFAQGFDDAQRSHASFQEAAQAFPPQTIAHVLSAMHHAARAQETFYLLRLTLPPFAGYWPLPEGISDSMPQRNDQAPCGVVHMSQGGYHGGFSWYVPEYYRDDKEWPVIVALHGGSGNGRDFLWSWLREARLRGYVLVAPSSRSDTWSEDDDQGLLQILSWLSQRYRLDRNRILLTGLSDGATFTLLFGLAHPRVYRALAPLCGVLHPGNEVVGNLARAPGMPIYLVHGALDFIFPVVLARHARDTLVAAGAQVEYRELDDLSHTYPRSENVRILNWFESLPTLATDGPPPTSD